RGREARGGGRELLERELGGESVEAHPVVLLGRGHPEEAGLAELVEHVAREVGGAVPLGRMRLDSGARELARQIDDLTLRLGKAGGLNRDRHRSHGRSSGPGAPPRPSSATAAPAGTWDRRSRGGGCRGCGGTRRGRSG